jgi:hypothetical protein
VVVETKGDPLTVHLDTFPAINKAALFRKRPY